MQTCYEQAAFRVTSKERCSKVRTAAEKIKALSPAPLKPHWGTPSGQVSGWTPSKGTWMRPAEYFLQVANFHPGVELRGRRRRMPQKLLNVPHISARSEQMRRTGMPKRVRCDAFRQAARLAVLSDDVIDRVQRQPPVTHQVPYGGVLLHLFRPLLSKILTIFNYVPR